MIKQGGIIAAGELLKQDRNWLRARSRNFWHLIERPFGMEQLEPFVPSREVRIERLFVPSPPPPQLEPFANARRPEVPMKNREQQAMERNSDQRRFIEELADFVCTEQRVGEAQFLRAAVGHHTRHP